MGPQRHEITVHGALFASVPNKLHAALCIFRLTEQGAQEIARLMHYSFTNTTELEAGNQTLREIVTLYATCHLENLWDSPDFQEVLLRQSLVEFYSIE